MKLTTFFAARNNKNWAKPMLGSESSLKIMIMSRSKHFKILLMSAVDSG